MNKPPETIYLQCYDETGGLLNLVHDDVTWCVDQINERDAIYKLEPAANIQRIEELEAEAKRWRREFQDEQVRRDEWEKMYNHAMVSPTSDAMPRPHSRSEHLERLFCAAQYWHLMINVFKRMRNSIHSGVRYQALGRPASDAKRAETTFWKILAELEPEEVTNDTAT